MRTIANIATAIFFAAMALFFLVSFIAGMDWPPLHGHGTSILAAILFGGLAYRVIWGMCHGE